MQFQGWTPPAAQSADSSARLLPSPESSGIPLGKLPEKHDRKKYESDYKHENIQNAFKTRPGFGREKASAPGISLGKVIFWILFGVIALNVLSTLLMAFL